MKQISIYLCGAISGCTHEEASDWRNKVKTELTLPDFKILDPMQGKDALKGKVIGNYSCELGGLYTSKAIVSKDLFQVRSSDIVLCNFSSPNKKMMGSMFEQGYAYSLGKVIINVLQQGGEYDHPFVKETGLIVNSLDEALGIIRSYQPSA